MSPNNAHQLSGQHRIDGKLHLVHHVRDEEVKLITTVTSPLKVEFRLEDLGQLLAGACVMALPVVLPSEVWDLEETHSTCRLWAVLPFSIFALTEFVWGLCYGKRIVEFSKHFFILAVSAYFVILSVSLLLLYLFDEAPLYDLKVTLTRTILVAFPTSFAVAAVDFMK